MLHNKPVFKNLRKVQLGVPYTNYLLGLDNVSAFKLEGHPIDKAQLDLFVEGQLELPELIYYCYDAEYRWVILNTYFAPIVLMLNSDGLWFLYSHSVIESLVRSTIGHISGLTDNDVRRLICTDGVINMLTAVAGLADARGERNVYDTYQFYP